MFPRIIHVRYIQDYWLELTFADGKQARLDFKGRVVGRGGVFAPLEDLDFFKRVRVDPEIGTLVLSLIHISEPTRLKTRSRIPSCA